jgi:hypothetical protein
MVGSTVMTMRLLRSKLRKREESAVNSPVRDNVEAQRVTEEPTHFPAHRISGKSESWVFPPLPPQPNIYTYNANSHVSTSKNMVLQNNNRSRRSVAISQFTALPPLCCAYINLVLYSILYVLLTGFRQWWMFTTSYFPLGFSFFFYMALIDGFLLLFPSRPERVLQN